jgi:hypothetical protein
MRSAAFGFMLLPGCLAVLAGGAVPGIAAAQSDFLFRPPVAAFTVRAGPMLYSANSDVFDDITTNLTLDRGDFRAPAFGAELVLMPSSRLDVVLGFMWSETSTNSEFRDWVDEGETPSEDDDLPIEQVTRLRTIPVTATLRYLLVSRGRRISQLSWLPNTVVPYVGAGAGVTWYRLQQEGDFVDFEDLAIFSDFLETTGQQTTFHGLAGVDYWFASRFGLNAEARYTYGSAEPNQSFSSYDNLDLGGLQATLGLSFRF